MLRYFTSLQIFVAAAISLALFIGLFWSEKTMYQRLSSLNNPLENTQFLNERLVVNKEVPQTWMHPSGELFMAFSGTKINFTNQARELEEGRLYIDSNFVSQADVDAAKRGFPAPFLLGTATPKVGQLKAGAIIVSVPRGIAVLKRDLIRQEVEIYAHDHPVDIFLPQAEEPFLLPAGHTVLVKEGRVDVLGALYYTKLKKELKLTRFDSTETKRLAHFDEPLAAGLALSAQWREQTTAYAEQVATSWERFSPNSFMGQILRALSYVQRYYAVGVDKPYKIDYQYRGLTSDLVSAYFALRNNEKLQAIESAQSFLALKASAEWARFFVEQPQFISAWDRFVRTQQVWMFYLFPEGLESELLWRLWGGEAELKSLEDYAAQYYRFEKFHAEGLRGPSENALDALPEKFAALSFELTDQSLMSRLRRQLSFKLQTEFNLRSDDSFTLYTQLVKAEQDILTGNSELQQEIQLEVAQELLFFLKDLLDSSTRKDSTVILLKTYRDLKVGDLYKTIGRTVFNQQESQTLDRIQSLGTLDDKALAAVRQSDAATADTLAALKILGTGSNTGPVEPVNLGLQTEADLVDELKAIGVLTQGMNTRLIEKEENNLINFSGASYNDYALSGVFRTDRQSFTLLKLGQVEDTRATVGNLRAFLQRMQAANKDLENTGTTVTPDEGPNPDTAAAVVKRSLMLKLLRNQGITVSIDNIIPINFELSRAQVSNATLDKQYLLTFVFDLDSQQAEAVEVQYGRSKILLAGQIFDYQNLSTALKRAIEDKLTEAAEKEADGA